MANKWAMITVSGEVQDAGFRGKVMRIAQKVGLVGYIENLPDGSARVICEGEEEVIKDFQKKLDIHEDDIEVEKIALEWSDATGEFKWFEVKFSDLGMEMFQGFATAGKKLGELKSETRSGFADLKGEMHSGFGRVEGAITSMHSDVNVRFDTLDEKYGEISRQMTVLTTELQKSTDALVSLTKEIGALIQKKLAE